MWRGFVWPSSSTRWQADRRAAVADAARRPWFSMRWTKLSTTPRLAPARALVHHSDPGGCCSSRLATANPSPRSARLDGRPQVRWRPGVRPDVVPRPPYQQDPPQPLSFRRSSRRPKLHHRRHALAHNAACRRARCQTAPSPSLDPDPHRPRSRSENVPMRRPDLSVAILSQARRGPLTPLQELGQAPTPAKPRPRLPPTSRFPLHHSPTSST